MQLPVFNHKKQKLVMKNLKLALKLLKKDN